MLSGKNYPAHPHTSTILFTIKQGMLHGPGHSVRVAQGRAKRIRSAGCVSLGMPRMGTWD